MGYNYSNKNYSKEHMARVVGRVLPISTKASIEICNNLRKKSVARAKTILKGVMTLKTPIKFTRFTSGAGHKKGIGAGKYPVKAAGEILKLLEGTESNAQFKGINTSNLIITHISAQKAGNVWRYGRFRRRKMKRTHIELIVKESKKEEPKKAEAGKKPGQKVKETGKEVKKTETKEKHARKEEKKEVKK